MNCFPDIPPVVRPASARARIHQLPLRPGWVEQFKAWVDDGREHDAIPWLMRYRRHAWAQALLGEIRFKTPRKARKAFGWFQRAAPRCSGEHPAVLRLAQCYAQGVGVAVNPFMARHWYLHAARGEVAEAFEALGDLEAGGLVHPINRLRAAMWYAISGIQLKDKQRADEVQTKMLDLVWVYQEPKRTQVLDRCFDDALQWMADNWNG